MILRVAVPAKFGDPTDEDVLAVVEATIAQRASAWTAPVHVATEDAQHIYEVDAQPRVNPSIITTSNIAPTLLPPRR